MRKCSNDEKSFLGFSSPLTILLLQKRKTEKSFDPWAFTDEETETDCLPKRRRSREEDVEIFPREKDTSLSNPAQCESNRHAITAERQLRIQGNNKTKLSLLSDLQAPESSQNFSETTIDKVDGQLDTGNVDSFLWLSAS